ncbi:MAG: type II toxin-antitoxin system Phd/YefM family antitoxin [Acaryochloris sp. RU_4_1]|nr:type II toxin-antitoxin system Phd/YefM family antitoxin [Acaryochloris sp. SU_5_25]NJM67885.1 type II toxin-antitoxin system Phd/YefM family antitoxin [Acaryochloris sp. RU_4_1]NJN38003.1 type II toxin-antitoxin system Phd/YefM family antitoxin [Acaryochloridaceae cyanobacterium CSU_3_4]NJR56618.1 type II toxin-antitoxin system Phd/YefM family antitoxin [Acaryochloris sp. CRU_2_0]
MHQVTSDYAKQHFGEILERASQEPEGIMITQDDKSFVLIDQKEFDALIETAELLKNPKLLSDIDQARQEYSRGEFLTMNQIFG